MDYSFESRIHAFSVGDVVDVKQVAPLLLSPKRKRKRTSTGACMLSKPVKLFQLESLQTDAIPMYADAATHTDKGSPSAKALPTAHKNMMNATATATAHNTRVTVPASPPRYVPPLCQAQLQVRVYVYVYVYAPLTVFPFCAFRFYVLLPPSL